MTGNRWWRGRRAAAAGVLAVLAGAAGAQSSSSPQTANESGGLDIPANLQIFGKPNPDVRKATAIVNNTVITGTDVDQRVALIGAANNVQIEGDERDQLKLQVLRQLIDETLQIQEAKSADITITADEINQSEQRLAGNFRQSPATLRSYLRQSGSSEASLRRQIEGELAWQRYLHRRIEPLTNVGDQEVAAILARLQADKGQTEYNLREIYLKAPEGAAADQVFARARQVTQEIGKGDQPFDAVARKYSDASTAGVGGDLGWVRASSLPTEMVQALTEMQVGQVAGPIQVPGGFSILYLSDKRQVLTADPRDSRLSLKQITVRFPPGATQAQAGARATEFGKVLQSIQGCGSVDKAARGIGAEVVDNDTVRIRDLPPQLQDIVIKMQVGQSTPPFGNPRDGIRSLVLCGRDDPRGGQLPSSEQVQNQLEQQRVNLRAQQKLRDLRRDAVVEYR